MARNMGLKKSHLSSVLFLMTLVSSTACSSTKPDIVERPGNGHVAGERVVDSLGVNIHGLVLSSAGYMIDLRYRVVDAEKAAPLMDKKIKPYLLVQATGARLDIPDTPKVGMLRQLPRNDSVKQDRDYFIMFTNAGHRLSSGDKVDMVVGQTRIENLRIQ